LDNLATAGRVEHVARIFLYDKVGRVEQALDEQALEACTGIRLRRSPED